MTVSSKKFKTNFSCFCQVKVTKNNAIAIIKLSCFKNKIIRASMGSISWASTRALLWTFLENAWVYNTLRHSAELDTLDLYPLFITLRMFNAQIFAIFMIVWENQKRINITIKHNYHQYLSLKVGFNWSYKDKVQG